MPIKSQDFGPGLSHAVLSAVPAVLTKKTTALRPVLKKLHILIAETDTPAVDAIEERKKQHGAGSIAASAVTRVYRSYDRLNTLLQEAPALLKKKPSDIDIRLQQLADILSESQTAKGSHSAVAIDTPAFTTSSSSSSSFYMKKAQQLAVGAPRLLIESKIERIIFRMRLLLCYNHQISHGIAKSNLDPTTLPGKRWNLNPSEINKKFLKASCLEIQTTAWIESLLATYPFVLAGPSSTLARLFFAHTAIGGTFPLSTSDSSSVHTFFPASTGIPEVPLTVDQLGSLLDCNTKIFLSRLSELCGEDKSDVLTCSYGRYLQVVVKELRSNSNSAIAEKYSEHPDNHFDTLYAKSTGSSECSDNDNDNGSVSVTESESFNDTTMVAVEQSERLLCGIFNDLCAFPQSHVSFHPSAGDALLDNPLLHFTTDADATSMNIKLSSQAVTCSVSTVGTNLKVANGNDRCRVNIKEEALRLDKLCQTICSVIIPAAWAIM